MRYADDLKNPITYLNFKKISNFCGMNKLCLNINTSFVCFISMKKLTSTSQEIKISNFYIANVENTIIKINHKKYKGYKNSRIAENNYYK